MRKIFFLCLVIFSFFVNQINAEEDETFLNFCYDFKKNIEKIWSILEQDLYIEYDTIHSKHKFAIFFINTVNDGENKVLAIGTLAISKRKENPQQQQEIFVFLQPYWPNLNKKTVKIFFFSLTGPITYLSGWECNKKFLDYFDREIFMALYKEDSKNTFNIKEFNCNNAKIIINSVKKQKLMNFTISILRPF